MNLLNLVQSRKSTRQFTEERISDETINEILNIALYAPSSWGGHPVEFIVIRDKEVLNKLAKCKAMGAGPLKYSDVAIVPIIDSRNLELWKEDLSVVSTYILLAAEYYDIGACWIHMDNRKGHTKSACEDIQDLLSIPKHYKVINAISLGIKKQKTNITYLSLENKIHKENF